MKAELTINLWDKDDKSAIVLHKTFTTYENGLLGKQALEDYLNKLTSNIVANWRYKVSYYCKIDETKIMNEWKLGDKVLMY